MPVTPLNPGSLSELDPGVDSTSASACMVVATLELAGLAAAIIGEDSAVLATNARFERLEPAMARRRGPRLELLHKPAGDMLLATLAASAAGAWSSDALLIPLPQGRILAPTILRVIPLRPSALVVGRCALLLAVPVEHVAIPSPDLLQALFDLTPAEARVAGEIGRRQTIAQAAKTLGLSPETVRSQLKSALAKLGAARNIDLAVLLVSAGHAAQQ